MHASLLYKICGFLSLILLTACSSGQSESPATDTEENAPVFRSENEANTQTVNQQTSGVQMLMPQKKNLSVPFASQAPFADWDLPYQEACEEASTIMANRYFRNQKLDPKIMNEEILKLIEWQKTTFGYYEDTTAEETARILNEYFGLTAKTSTDVTKDSIIKNIAQGNLVLVPASGRALKNPNFRGTDAFYHMLVVRGYDSKHFITNDPGTRKGEGYKYDFATLLSANHDWTGSKDTIDTGPKTMIVVSRE